MKRFIARHAFKRATQPVLMIRVAKRTFTSSTGNINQQFKSSIFVDVDDHTIDINQEQQSYK